MSDARGDVPAAARQVVTAVAGFAYGVIGADIHVFGDGTPVYVLENWQPAPQADREWLREMHSRMLNARFAVVGFTGRDAELGQLRQWRDSGPRLAVRWLHGPGGQGKTRLAAQLAAESAEAGWKVVAATHGPGTVLPPPGSQDLGADGAAGLLMVVDYADQWPLSHLTWLLSNALLHQTGVASRVLMLARTDDSWPAVRAALAGQQASTSSLFLTPLPEKSRQRRDTFTAARDSFADVYRIADPAGIEPPGPLDGPDLGLTLAVHMAALVAVDAHVSGCRPPTTMAGLTIYLLDREHLHWQRLYGDWAHRIDPATHRFVTPPAVMNRVVFTAALTGPRSRQAGTALLDALDLAQPPRQVLDDHAICYPPGDTERATVLVPLYPDRLAEDFLALTMPGHLADYPARNWAASTATTVFARHGGPYSPAPYIPRAVTFLATATQRWPHLAESYLNRLLCEDPQLAIDGGSAALTALAAADGVDITVLEAIETLLPDHRHVDLDPGIAALATRLARHRLDHTDDPAARARINNDLGTRLSNAGLYEQALLATEEAVRIRQGLAAADPLSYEPSLATALTNLAIRLSDLGRREQALATSEQAVALYRKLATADRAAFEPGLATALSNLGVELRNLGRRADALSATEQATDVFRRLALASPDAFEPGLARTLNNLGVDLSERGRPEEGLTAVEQAVGMYRRLAAANPAAFEPELARATSNAGVWLTDLGRREEGLTAGREAVALYRRLATANQAAFEPQLARSLSNLGAWLWGLGQREEGLAAAGEAVVSYRRLAAANPAAHEPELARSLSNLGVPLWALGRREEALSATEEAVGVHRKLAGADPAAFEPAFATTLSNYGIRLLGLGRRADALTATSNAVALHRRLAEADPAVHEPDLARSVTNLGTCLSELGRREEGLTAAEEAVVLHRRLAAANPVAYEPDLARSLGNVGLRLSELGRPDDALTAAEQAVTLYRRLAGPNPATFEPDLARSLSNLGILLHRQDRQKEAQSAFEDAVGIGERLVAANPDAFEADLATALTNLSASHSETRPSGALTAARQATDVYRKLAAENPDAFEPSLARSLTNVGMCLYRMDRLQEAWAAAEQTVQLYRRLAAAYPAAFEPELATALSNLSLPLSALGRHEEALIATDDAMQIRRPLAAANPAVFEPDLADSLWICAATRATLHTDLHRALRLARESAAIYRSWSIKFPAKYAGDLRAVLAVAADILTECGRISDATRIRRLTASDTLDNAAGALHQLTFP